MKWKAIFRVTSLEQVTFIHTNLQSICPITPIVLATSYQHTAVYNPLFTNHLHYIGVNDTDVTHVLTKLWRSLFLDNSAEHVNAGDVSCKYVQRDMFLFIQFCVMALCPF